MEPCKQSVKLMYEVGSKACRFSEGVGGLYMGGLS